MSGVIVRDNVINGTSAVPAIHLAQVADTKGNYPLLGCRVTGNKTTLAANAMWINLVEATAGGLNGRTVSGNSFPMRFRSPDSTPSFKFDLAESTLEPAGNSAVNRDGVNADNNGGCGGGSVIGLLLALSLCLFRRSSRVA